jgi:hypothetical protein
VVDDAVREVDALVGLGASDAGGTSLVMTDVHALATNAATITART